MRSVALRTCGVVVLSVVCVGLLWQMGSSPVRAAEPEAQGAAGKVSYFRDVRPIFQVQCQGCHQPAKLGGGYLMTTRDGLLKGGDSGSVAIVPGQPDKSYLYEIITPKNGKAEMPKGKAPLSEAELDLIKRWIAQGAVDDSPKSAQKVYDPAHPPVYTRLPVITSLDFSPEGALLAVAGFHEVLLVKSDTGELQGRLIGLSERIESVRFSPDGKRLLVTGGLPGRTGEVQVWDVAARKLTLSVAVTADTIYGGSWSPHGEQIAFGCADNTVRAIDAKTGAQVLFQGAHSDWVRDTVFTVDGGHVVSVSRDMTTKLTEVATQRFIDNVTSITPGVLKGGIQAITRHPTRNEVVIGASDGVTRVYNVFRQTNRVIGDDANLIREMPAMRGRVWGVAVSKDGKRIASCSSLDGQGQVHIYSYEFSTEIPANIKAINSKVVTTRSPQEKETLAAFHKQDVKLIAQAEINSSGIYAVAFHPDGKTVAAAGSDGAVRLIDAASGQAVKVFHPAPVSVDLPTTKTVTGTAAGTTARTAPAAGTGSSASGADFIRDVNPIMSKLGCNQGTCHGAAKGKNGFKLSLRGYDALFDVRALTDDLASRRVNVASPDDSLMLLKATGAVPHVGGALIQPHQPYYQVLRNWIADGARLDLSTPRVTKIEVQPSNPLIEKVGGRQSMKIVATYADGKTRDVTSEAFVESGNIEVATADRAGVLTALRRGEAPVLARYEGAYAATTLTVMGDRNGFVWQDPPKHNKIDEFTAAKWQRMKIIPSELCSDTDFIRRVFIDLTGLPPTADDVRNFLADTRDSKTRRDELVDKLVGSDAYIDHWTNKWADLLQVNRKFLGVEGATGFREWIRGHVARNTRYDEFARQIVTASGSNKENPAASYFKILRDPQSSLENTTHLFLGVRFNCNKCHDHPFEKWTQDQYYQTAAYFAQVERKEDPASGGRRIGGTAVEGAKPLFEVIADTRAGEVLHDRTGEVTPPVFPFSCDYQAPQAASRRQQFASWMSSSHNPYFAKSYVNRLWGYLFGRGIMEPIDDLRAGNPPTNPELIEYLTQEFIQSGFDIRHIQRLICKSRTYQLSVATNKWNADDSLNYSHATARRLNAEALFDAVHRVTGTVSKLPGTKPGARAAELPDSSVDLPSGFFTTFGRPVRESACECERSSGLQLGPIMALISGPTIADAIADPTNELTRLAQTIKEDDKLVNELFLRILNRPATPGEIQATLVIATQIDADHLKVVAAVKARETEIAPLRAKLEDERQQALKAAQATLSAYEKEIAPKVAEQEKQRQEKIAAAEKAHAESLKQFAARQAAWEQSLPISRTWTTWMPLDVKSVQATGNVKLELRPQQTVFASGGTGINGITEYTVVAETNLAGITGILLEVLPDEAFPKFGPGRHESGNFVLSELTLQWAKLANKANTMPGTFQAGKADYTQQNFDVKQVFDGKNDPAASNGWAIGGTPAGQPHWAAFQLAQPLGDPAGAVLTFKLHQRFRDGFSIGKFRLWVTTSVQPLDQGLPAHIAEIVKTPPTSRKPEQLQTLTSYFREFDPELRKHQQALVSSKQPLPTDPKLIELRTKLTQANQPVPPDATLVRLQNDLKMSEQQLANKRLTLAQDLAWALINSPAFLFNH